MTGTMVPHRSKAMEMRFHWLRCREAQSQFRYLWRRGALNRADYFTKHFPLAHHQECCSEYLVHAAEGSAACSWHMIFCVDKLLESRARAHRSHVLRGCVDHPSPEYVPRACTS